MKLKTDSMQEYLAATQLCDFDNPWLRETAEAITTGGNTPREKALGIFYFVRDEIRFGLAYSRTKASQTLRRGYGECGSKTNLHVALLRAVGIPARLRWVKVRSSVLRGLILDPISLRMPPSASHFWPECFVDDKWISCEAFLDKPLYEGMLKKGLIIKEQVPMIDWDGKTDLIILAPWIVEDCGTLSSVDEALDIIRYSDEGMPPLWLERIIAPVFFPLNLRPSDRIRQLASS